MRRLVVVMALVALPALAWLALGAALRALVVPRLTARVGAPVRVASVGLGWPPALVVRGIRVLAPSPLESAREIRVGISGVVLSGAQVRWGVPSAPAGLGPEALAPPASPLPLSPPALPNIRIEDATVRAVWRGAWIEARGVAARPRSGGWRVTARSLSAGRDGIDLHTGPAAADLTEKRVVRRLAVTRATVQAHGVHLGPLLLRATDAWTPDGIRLDLTLPENEARLGGEPLTGWVAGHIEIRLSSGGSVHIEATLTARDLIIRHPALAHRPVGPMPLALHIRADLGVDRGSVQELALQSGAIRARASGAWGAEGGDVVVQLAHTACAAALASLPEGLAPALRGMRADGELSASARFRFDRRRPDQASLDIDFPALCQILGDPPGAPMTRVGAQVAALRSYGRHVPNAFRVAEDLRFFDHRGFDAEQIRRALIHDIEQRAFSRGASTISQQVVKNLFLTHERTLSRKLQEAVLTWRMEQVVPKRRILEAYLDLVELGPGIRGVEAASRSYFGRAAKDLTPLQAVHLAALTPAPVALARQLSGGVSQEWRTRLDELLDFMRHQRLLAPADWIRARAERLRFSGDSPTPPLARRQETVSRVR